MQQQNAGPSYRNGLSRPIAATLDPETVRTEASIRRAVAPSSLVLLAGRRCWRWTVTRYVAVETTYPGVLDGRLHLIADGGYTRTLIGAVWAVGRRVRVHD